MPAFQALLSCLKHAKFPTGLTAPAHCAPGTPTHTPPFPPLLRPTMLAVTAPQALAGPRQQHLLARRAARPLRLASVPRCAAGGSTGSNRVRPSAMLLCFWMLYFRPITGRLKMLGPPSCAGCASGPAARPRTQPHSRGCCAAAGGCARSAAAARSCRAVHHYGAAGHGDGQATEAAESEQGPHLGAVCAGRHCALRLDR